VLLLKDLLNCTRERLLGIPNFGEKALEQVFQSLHDVGLACTVQEDGQGRWSYVGDV
jgi:DNA-directed RNA polymerase alpha subunit